MEDGLKYVISKEGIIKFIVILFGCVTFALLADTGYYYSTEMKWVLAAFIISFSLSVLFYFFRLIKLAPKMNCGGPFSYDGFDFLWAWFSTIWCLTASIVFSMHFPKSDFYKYGEAIGSIIFAYLTVIAYAVEAFFLRLYAPANIGFVATKPGWIKTAIVVFGAATFGLMVESGYNWCWWEKSCDAGTTYALVVFCVAWSVTTLMWIGHMAAPKGSIEGSPAFQKVEFVWAIIGILFFLSGASCFAAYMDCSGNDFDNLPKCQKRLTGVIAGFLVGVLYLVEAVMLKP
ncbi:myeloid-associated differentiation marker-like protein 2 [Styela clava]